MTEIPTFFKGPIVVPDRAAAALATLVQEKWHALGYTRVRAWIEARPFRDGDQSKTIQVVRSNLIGGLPRAPAEEAGNGDAADSVDLLAGSSAMPTIPGSNRQKSRPTVIAATFFSTLPVEF